MARPKKWIAEENAAFGWGPLREYWREINRQDKKARAEEMAKRKARGKRRRKCGCEAYPWPHRPGGGFCRYPDPPIERWQPPVTGQPRPYRDRYAGLRRQLARASGLHPIRDRAAIEKYMPFVLSSAKNIKQKAPRVKYRNMRITHITKTDIGFSIGMDGTWQTAGPMM